jgi:hypothetical protein
MIMRRPLPLVGIAIAWLVIAGIAMLTIWPSVPQSPIGWIVFFIFAPPLYVLGEALFEYLWSTRLGRAISNHPSRLVRISTGVVFGCVLLAISVWLQT